MPIWNPSSCKAPRQAARYARIKYLALGLIGFCLSAWGSSLQVSPLRIDLNEKQRIEIVSLKNRGDEPIHLQLEIKRWRQINGKNIYSNTHEILVTPPIVSITPNKEQIIRVGLINPSDSIQELSYRLYITEIPEKQISHQPGGEVRITSKIGIPIFVNSSVYKIVKPIWRCQAKKQNQHLNLSLSNLSNEHIKILSLMIKTNLNSPAIINSQEVRYILPKQTLNWSFPLSGTAVDSTSFVVEADTNKGRLSTIVKDL